MPAPVAKTWLTMGTFASVTVRGDSQNLLEDVFNTTKTCFADINQSLSTYIPTSEISSINASTGTVSISALVYDVMKSALYYNKISDGAFDPTLRPLIQLWGFNGAKVPTNLPSAEAVAATLQKTGCRHLELHPDASGYSLHAPIHIDLGGIAKGYAVDRAYDLIVAEPKLNSASFMINLGGNIRCHGQATPERNWVIGVRNPFDGESMVGSLSLESGMAVATSGNYERFVMIKGQRYAHIIDPRSGYPVKGMAGVTVISSNATETDGMSTALYVAGLQEAPHILRKLQDCQAIIIPDKQPMEIWISAGMQKSFKPFPEYAACVHQLPEDDQPASQQAQKGER
jgi:thiamine biosynthesis lipoprotein